MTLRNLSISFVVGVYVLMASPGVSLGAVDNQYIEDFTTDLFRDTATTAWWDTTTGELKLHPFAMTHIGSDPTTVPARDVAISGDLALVAADAGGLRIIDIKYPGAPDPVSSLALSGRSYGVVAAGDHAYVTSWATPGHFWAVDISDPLNPTLAGDCAMPGRSYGLAVAGDHAFVADYNAGLQVVDISDPTDPQVIGGVGTGDKAYSVALAGDHAYVAGGDAGLAVIDISDPGNPSLVGSWNTPGEAFGVAVAGDHVFIADNQTGLQVIDVSDPLNPSPAGWIDTPGIARDVVVEGDIAYVADGGSGFHMIDISQPANPVLYLSLDSEDAYRVAVAGEHAFVADASGGLRVVEIRLPTNPTLAGSCRTQALPKGVTVAGDLALVAEYGYGLQVIDITDPANPTLVGSFRLGQAQDVAMAGDLALVADGESGLQVIDISDPANPIHVGSYDTLHYALGLAVTGDLALVADYSVGGLQVIDITDPANPALVGSYHTPGQAGDVAVAGALAFVADGESGLQVFDITDPANPTRVGSYNTPGRAHGVAVAGNLAFVADGDFGLQVSGLQVIDITDPANPTLVGSCDTPGDASDVAVAGDLAFVADGSWLQVIDITDPANPTLIGDYTVWAEGVAVAGDLAFVADSSAWLQVIQVFQSEVDIDNNVGQSLAVDGQTDTILRGRLSSTQTSAVFWELSADAGASWQSCNPGGPWTAFTVPGNDLIWRSTHRWAGSGNPTVSELSIGWLNEFGPITSIIDVPDDQGGRVYVQLKRSGYDFADEAAYPVNQYGVYRRVDDPLLVAKIESAQYSRKTTPALSGGLVSSFSPNGSGIMLDGTTYIVGSTEFAAAGTFPPGTWALVASVPATQNDEYLTEVTTVADSTAAGTAWSTFLVTTHTTTPSVWFVCPPDSGYSVDNLAPPVPTEFAVAYDSEGNLLTWSPSDAPDFDHFRIYRGMEPDFIPAEGNLVHTTTESSWLDAAKSFFDYHYKLSSVDLAGNKSDPTGPATVSGAQDGGVPARTSLLGAVPNPFNSATKLSFEMASPGHACLKVYDTAGRRVVTLIDEHRNAGRHHVIWDGRNAMGRMSAAGVYLYRLEVGEYNETKRMTLVK